MTSSIEKIKERWSKATPGPWSADCQPGDCVVWGRSEIERNKTYRIKEVFLCNVDSGETNPVAYDMEKENAEAIAHAPDDIVFLLREIDRLNSKIRELHEELDTPEHD